MRIGPELFFHIFNTLTLIVLIVGLVVFVIALTKIPGYFIRKEKSAKNTEKQLESIAKKIDDILNTLNTK